MADPAMIARITAAASICPRWPRSAWISALSGAVDPMIASVDIAEIRSAFCPARHAPNSPASAHAVENCVPLMSASPSFAASAMGARPAARSAAAPGSTAPPTSASPSPSITAAMCASGARSPLAPTDPWTGTTGTTPAASIPCRSSTSSQRTPDAPRPSDTSFSAIISRTTAPGVAAPTPAQCDRIRFRCSRAVSSGGTLTLASFPKPVFTP